MSDAKSNIVSSLREHWKVAAVLAVVLTVLVCEGAVLWRQRGTGNAAAGEPAVEEGAFFIALRDDNPHVPRMYRLDVVQRTLRRAPPVDLAAVRADLDAFIAAHGLRNASLDAPSSWPQTALPFVAGSTGAVTSCRLDALCLASLLVLANVTRGTLPLELWVDAPLPPAHARAVARLLGPRVRVRDLRETAGAYAARFGALEPALFRNAFHRKLQALASSAFARALWVDGDAFVLRDPRPALARPAPVVVWRDMSAVDARNPVWALLGAPPARAFGGESGLVLVDKGDAGAARALQLAAYMNQHQNAFYRLVYGDKDTLALACRALRVPHTVVPHLPTVVGRRSFLQAAPDGRPLFVHLAAAGKRDFVDAMHSSDPHAFWGRIPRFDPNDAHVARARGARLAVVADRRGARVRAHDPARVVGAQSINLIHDMYRLAEAALASDSSDSGSSNTAGNNT